MPPSPDPSVELTATVVLFGFESRPAVARVIARPRTWRVGGAARRFALFALVAPLAAVVPPHAPWALGAVGVGTILARRRLRERFTLVGIEARCPKCDEPVGVRPTRLRTPHPLVCETCHHESALKIEGPLPDVDGGG